MPARKRASIPALVAALLLGFFILCAAIAINVGNQYFPDEFGQVTPPADRPWAWLAVGVAMVILGCAGFLLFQEFRRRMDNK